MKFDTFDHYNFISCIYRGEEVIFWRDQRMVDSLYYTIDSEDTPDPAATQPDSIYDVMKDGLGFSDDTMLVCVMGYKYCSGIDEISRHIKGVGPEKILYFNDDAHTRWLQDDDAHIDTTSILSKTPEGCTISDLVADIPIPYHIYDCEYKARKHFTGIPKENYGYYDIFTQTFPLTKVEALEQFVPQDEFQYKICCTNRRHQIHRLLACVYLIDSPHEVKLTYYFKPRQKEMQRHHSLCGTKLHHIDPFIPTTFDMLSEEMQKNLNDKYMLFTFADLTWDANEAHEIHGIDQLNSISITADSFLTLVAETLWDTNEAFWSEKTLKPMMMLRPFVVLSSPKTLALIRKLGFKTFNKFWDESYDNEKNDGKRFEKVMKIVDTIKAKTIPELEVMLKEMNKILIHNKKHLDVLHTRTLKS